MRIRDQHPVKSLPHSPSHISGCLIGAIGLGVAGAWCFKRHKEKILPKATRLSATVTIDRPAIEVYRYWRELGNLPSIMTFLHYVEPMQNDVSRWVACSPGGATFEWYSEITEDIPGEILSWRSLKGSEPPNWGTVVFSRIDDKRKTQLSLIVNFCPTGTLRSALSKFLSGIERAQLDQNLRNLKHHLERNTGSVLNNSDPPP